VFCNAYLSAIRGRDPSPNGKVKMNLKATNVLN
jgi:hypothetical protein